MRSGLSPLAWVSTWSLAGHAGPAVAVAPRHGSSSAARRRAARRDRHSRRPGRRRGPPCREQRRRFTPAVARRTRTPKRLRPVPRNWASDGIEVLGHVVDSTRSTAISGLMVSSATPALPASVWLRAMSGPKVFCPSSRYWKRPRSVAGPPLRLWARTRHAAELALGRAPADLLLTAAEVGHDEARAGRRWPPRRAWPARPGPPRLASAFPRVARLAAVGPQDQRRPRPGPPRPPTTATSAGGRPAAGHLPVPHDAGRGT